MNTNVYENTDSETITPLNKRRILPVFLLVGLYAASTAAVMSVLPFYIREMGGSPLIIGIIIATEAFSQFCAAPLIGHLSDRVGRKRILIVTLAIAAISLLLLANAQCILFILLARTLFGISAGNLSAAAAYIADCTHVRNRRQAIGILTGCIGLGGIVGAGVSGWLSRISLSAPIYAAFILVLGSALVAIWGLKDPSTTSRTTDKIAAFSARAILKMPVLRVLIIVMLCHFFAYGMYSSQLPVFLSDTFIWNGLPFGPKALSYLLMADGVINIFVQLFLLDSKPMKVKAVFINKPGEVETRWVDYPHKKENEVLIKVDAAGICGSDIGAFRGTNPLVTYPRIIGHEVTGIVLQEGAGMPDNIKEGDRVIVDPYIYCGHCYPCSVGRTNCCENLNVIGVHVDGAMQEVVTHPAHLIHKIPDNVPSEMAPLAEPLTIALHALHRANVKAGEYVAIIGAGAIGLMAALSARHYKATPILIDIVEERLRYAQKLGVPYVLNAADDQVIDAIKNITHGTMAQVVIEASGANSAIRNTLDLASFAGRISFTGWPKQETSLPTNLITYKELDLRGSRTSAGEFDEALRMLSTLEINPQDVVSKVVNLDEIPDAVKELDRYPERYLKINAVFH